MYFFRAFVLVFVFQVFAAIPSSQTAAQSAYPPLDEHLVQTQFQQYPQQQYPRPIDLPIQNIPQETEVWCWAAVAQQIIAATRGPGATPPQCALVAIANNAPAHACCSSPNPACVRTGSLGQIQALIAHFGGRYSVIQPPTDPMTLYRTLANGNAVIVQVRTGYASAHVIVVRGMYFEPTPYGAEPMLIINDPMSYYTQPVPLRNILSVWVSSIVVG